MAHEGITVLTADPVSNEFVLQKEEMPGVQYIDWLTGVMFQEDCDGSFDAGEMTGIMLFGILEVGNAQMIDQNLL